MSCCTYLFREKGSYAVVRGIVPFLFMGYGDLHFVVTKTNRLSPLRRLSFFNVRDHVKGTRYLYKIPLHLHVFILVCLIIVPFSVPSRCCCFLPIFCQVCASYVLIVPVLLCRSYLPQQYLFCFHVFLVKVLVQPTSRYITSSPCPSLQQEHG